MNYITEGSSNELVSPLSIARSSFFSLLVLRLLSLLIKQHYERFAQMCRTLCG